MKTKNVLGIGAVLGGFVLAAAPSPPLRVQQNRLNDRQQMQQRELQQRQLSQNTPPAAPQIQPVRSDLRQNPTPQERQQINLENNQKQMQHRQQMIAQPQPNKPQPNKPQPNKPQPNKPQPNRSIWDLFNWIF